MYYNTARLTLAKINDCKNHSDSHHITDHAQLLCPKRTNAVKMLSFSRYEIHFTSYLAAEQLV